MKNKILNFKNPRNRQQRLVVFNKRISYKTVLSALDIFLHSDLYAEICETTKFLDSCSDVEIPAWFRIKCIFKDVTEIQTCPICGKSCSVNISTKDADPIFKKTCGSLTCVSSFAAKHIKPQTNDLKKLHKIAMIKRRKRLTALYKAIIEQFNASISTSTYYSADDIKNYCLNIKQHHVKNGLLIRESDYVEKQTMLVDILKMTSFISLPKHDDTNISASIFNWHERIYCILNDIRYQPLCKYCGIEHVKFFSGAFKYMSSCAKCSRDKQRESMGLMTLASIQQNIDTNKYEIISFPLHDLLHTPLRIKCKKCGYISEMRIYNGKAHKLKHMLLCKNCEKYVSNGENEVRNFLIDLIGNSNDIRINSHNIISPLELDIYIPSRKLAIEFDGLYWHNDNVIKSNYHFKKTSECDDKGIRLVHIFEDEWLNHKKLCKSKLKKLICPFKLRHIDSALCEIVEVDDDIKQLYLNKYTFYGNDGSSKQYCLKYHSKIVAMMTFSKTRYNRQHSWQILNYIEVDSCIVDNGFETLLNHFKRIVNSADMICYYASRDWEAMNDYGCMKFVELKKPCVYWNVKSQRISSYAVDEAHAKQICKTYDDSLSLIENMNNNGFYRVYDSGTLVFEAQSSLCSTKD